VALTGVAVTDDQGVVVSCPKGTLAAGEEMVCQGSGVARAGQYANRGTVRGSSPDGSTVTASDDSYYLGLVNDPAVDIQKWTNGQDADSAPGAYVLVGEPVLWEYRVTNVGNVQIADLAVSDDQGVEVSCPGTALAPGASMVCTGRGTARVGAYANTGTVTGRAVPLGTALNDSDPSHYFGMAPGLSLEKRTNGRDADSPPGPILRAGEAVTWTYEVRNSGNVELTGLQVRDDQELQVLCPAEILAPGETVVCTAAGAAELGSYANLGTAIAFPPAGTEVAAHDASHYLGVEPHGLHFLPLVVHRGGPVYLPLVWRSAGARLGQ
jgi:hypothetical protein